MKGPFSICRTSRKSDWRALRGVSDSLLWTAERFLRLRDRNRQDREADRSQREVPRRDCEESRRECPGREAAAGFASEAEIEADYRQWIRSKRSKRRNQNEPEEKQADELEIRMGTELPTHQRISPRVLLSLQQIRLGRSFA